MKGDEINGTRTHFIKIMNMKTIAIIIFIFCSNVLLVNAQGDYNKDKICSGKEVYYNILMHPSERYRIYNVKNKLTNTPMKIPEWAGFSSIEGPKTDEKIVSIFQSVMDNNDILTMKKAKGQIGMTFCINDTGRILEIEFSFNKKKPFNPKYFALVEEQIKKEVVFTLLSNELKGANFVRFNRTYRF